MKKLQMTIISTIVFFVANHFRRNKAIYTVLTLNAAQDVKTMVAFVREHLPRGLDVLRASWWKKLDRDLWDDNWKPSSERR